MRPLAASRCATPSAFHESPTHAPADQLTEWVEPDDGFVRYARADDADGMVAAFVQALEADFQRFSSTVPLRPFFDRTSIRDGQYWQDVIRKGLRQSKVPARPSPRSSSSPSIWPASPNVCCDGILRPTPCRSRSHGTWAFPMSDSETSR